MAGFRRSLATSDHVVARSARAMRDQLRHLSVPAPRLLTVPMRIVFTTVRGAWHQCFRIFIAEPIFKSYCRTVGRRYQGGTFIHWVQGAGDIFLGDDVTIDGKVSFTFASRFTDRPTIRIGDRTGIGHASLFVIARSITIGADCRIAGGVGMRDSPGHPLDPEARRRGDPPPPEAIRPIVVEDNVWIGTLAMIMGGVTIGTGSVIAAGSVVQNDVPPYSLMAGNPARRIGTTQATPPSDQGAA